MMTVLCLACAALAVWWGVPPPRPERSAGLMESVTGPGSGAGPGPRSLAGAAPPGPSAKPLSGLVLGGLASVLVVVIALVLDGGRGAVLGLALLVLAWTVTGLLRLHRHARLMRRRRAEVAQACAALAAQLRVGQVPSVALATAAEDHPVLREARDAQDLGGDVVRVWRVQARQAGAIGLLELARAWQVSGQTGAPMSAALEQVAAALAAEQDLRAVVAGELSAPRATGKVMAVLPGCGVALGYLLGGEPIGWLLGGPLGWGCLLAGAVLACLGVLWIEALARRAAV
jgi:tight adherence protein B